MKSVTSEGVTALVRNSSNLLTFCSLVCYAIFDDKSEIRLRREFFDRQLFIMGTFIVEVVVNDILPMELKNTDLFSLWEK